MSIQKHYLQCSEVLSKGKVAFDLRWADQLMENGKPSDFSIQRTLSVGTYGRVLLAQYTKSMASKYIAIKLVEKTNIVKNKQVEHTIEEIRVLDAIRHNFVVHLEYFFKDNCYLYICMPYINGGELFAYLKKEKRFNEYTTKLYAMQIFLGLEYLHHMGLVYRDLKPENILINKDGYLRIADFGYCKKVGESRTWTLCGTPEYLAPEVILSHGYNKSVDYWSAGILIYELASGVTPFVGKDPMKLYEKIISCKYDVPQYFSPELKDILSHLIVVDRTKRYGLLRNGIKDIKGHAFFQGVEWDDIYMARIHPKFKPRVSGNSDSTNFPPVEEIELRTSEKDEYADQFKNIKVTS